MTLALALTGVVFLALAIIMSILAEESSRWNTTKIYARIGYIALALSTTAFLTSIWTHALT
ncbi:hypothetical protein [Jonesia denitrificans]|uniref:Uncharacterized protein n=1 Tax=Jonesia denitrificans (strain ATCC 14870 / DSM 20603 / BCRC 15368 / CIP 55.134 / JCM 11481 / NBRC 15587 / NCTC 10816 / Prevot 55134) TaxID=471856 RepID=C7R250_JONDD|nr:hypothetical protein [Jonesia denitrificans]ACV09938.1 hypothetical protein Jden_2303 [Jonesia denitrificans DSM 20603]ASE08822.1 hypothetical protein CEP80_06500 [Jonesia denitrificans]ASE08879.1 hypothetical protein CEP80_06800 [Jonesia denitrificans]QXB43428.1 hypothetical protein I6L70_00460 [Jonesia denitrificans]SQH22690.1 Uncharacterised protein [Jonesia denitrificans]